MITNWPAEGGTVIPKLLLWPPAPDSRCQAWPRAARPALADSTSPRPTSSTRPGRRRSRPSAAPCAPRCRPAPTPPAPAERPAPSARADRRSCCNPAAAGPASGCSGSRQNRLQIRRHVHVREQFMHQVGAQRGLEPACPPESWRSSRTSCSCSRAGVTPHRKRRTDADERRQDQQQRNENPMGVPGTRSYSGAEAVHTGGLRAHFLTTATGSDRVGMATRADRVPLRSSPVVR